jgi:hypothetical protein
MFLSASIWKPRSDAETAITAVRIQPPPIPASYVRPSKHLALVIDTSGSMEGTRLDAVKRTLHLLADTLAVGDRLSLIRYSSESTFALESATLEPNRAPIHAAIDGLVADGGTNLESAIHRLKDLLQRTSVDSVFLLTDGHINEGIKSGAGLLRLLGHDVPPLHTLGFGEDYNAGTLKTMSVATRGSHTYADAAELIPAIIGDIVGGLGSELGTLGKLAIPPGWRCLEMGSEENATQYCVGTLVSEKDHWIVLQGPSKDIPTSLTFTYTDAQKNLQTCTIPIQHDIPSVEIAEQLCRTMVANAYQRATDLLADGKHAEAKAQLDELMASLNDSIAKDRPFVVRLLAQVDEMLEELRRPAYRMHAGVAPRMTSNMVALGVQRGIVSRLQSAGPQTTDYDLQDAFRSPAQRSASSAMSTQYSQRR